MKLVRRIDRLEGRKAERQAIGMVWTDREDRLPEEERAKGRVVKDLRVTGQHAFSTHERLARSKQDHGDVFDENGKQIGHVVQMQDGLISLVFDEGVDVGRRVAGA